MKASHLGWLNAPTKLVDRAAAKLVGERAATVEITKPLLILGPERSGTTLLYSLLANHPDLYWFSRLDSIVPDAPVIATRVRQLAARLSSARRQYHAIPGTISRSRGALPPSECLPYWRGIFHWGDEQDYGVEDDRFLASELTEETRLSVARDLRTRLGLSGKPRLLFKQPGFSLKISFLDALFPDAIFIHCVRHPMDNLLSMVKAKRGSGERYWGTKIPAWRDYIDADPTLQAAVQIEAVERIIAEDVALIDDREARYTRVRLEDLQTDGAARMAELLEFCQLDPSSAVDSAMSHVVSRDAVKDYSSLEMSPGVVEIVKRLCSQADYPPP
jgi:hypothetical protein